MCLAPKTPSYTVVKDKSEPLCRAVESFKHFKHTIALVFHPAFNLPEVMGAQQTHSSFPQNTKKLARCSVSLKQLRNYSNFSDDTQDPLAAEHEHWTAGITNRFLRYRKLPGKKKS